MSTNYRVDHLFAVCVANSDLSRSSWYRLYCGNILFSQLPLTVGAEMQLDQRSSERLCDEMSRRMDTLGRLCMIDWGSNNRQSVLHSTLNNRTLLKSGGVEYTLSLFVSVLNV